MLAQNIKLEHGLKKQLEAIFFLSDVIGRKVILNDKKIGKLSDFVILETEKVPQVSHLIVKRSFGYQSLLVPWNKVSMMDDDEIIIDIENPEKYEKEPKESQVLLKDHVLDKKVLDLDGNEIEVVYDVKLVLRGSRLYVSDVDVSKYGMLKRIGLRGLARLIYKLADKVKKQTISWAYIQPLPEHMTSFKGNVKLKVLKEKLPEIHPVDLADILEELDHEQRLAIFNELETEHASDTLEEIEPRVQRDLISSLKKEKVAELINDMTPGQAADVLAILPAADADDILTRIDKENAQKIEYLLDKHEENIQHFATSHFLKFLANTLVKQIVEDFKNLAQDKDVIMYLYVVDKDDTLLGVVDIKELLEANPGDRLQDIMTTNVISLNPQNTMLEASHIFLRYSFRAIPVTDENDKILGAVLYRDIMNLKHRFI